MSVLFQTVINSTRLNSFRKTLKPILNSCKCVTTRSFSDAQQRFKTFDEVVAQRRLEARRSIVVQVNSESSFSELYGYCSKYAKINGIHHYKNTADEHFMLVEFATEEDAKDVLKNCGAHQKDLDVMALQSPFLWFRAVSGKKATLTTPQDVSLVIKNGSAQVDEDELIASLQKCETVSQQIQMLYDKTMLNDLGVRLRYMVARQLEIMFSSLYANIAVRPFGSSVNGFGRMGCDLDLVLTNVLTDAMAIHMPNVKNKKPINQSNPEKRLVYQEKKCDGGRSPWQRHMELVAELVELRVPGATRVQRILNARVPIVKYAQNLAGLDVDLCYSNMSGVYMSELLWLLGSLDPRVRPLAFAVRRWAAGASLTNHHPGRWVTNFPLTLMVIFFLQQKTQGGFVLPSVKYLMKKAGKEDIKIAEDNVNCTFLRDLNKLPDDSYGQSSADLGTLLLQFFEFYSQFDFNERAISVVEGVAVRKPNALPLYIVNPLEPALNVSRNVSYEECERIRMEVRNAAWSLESATEKAGTGEWGLLPLIEKRSTTRGLKKLLRVGNSHRLVSVKDLFREDDDESDPKTPRLTKSEKEIEQSVKEMKIAMLKEERKEQKMKFKNSQVASEVYRIQRNKIQ